MMTDTIYIQDCVVGLKITEQEPVVWSRQRRKTSSWLCGRLGWNRSINVSHNPLPSLALHCMDIVILPLLFLSTCLGHQIFASPPFFISNQFYLPKWIWPKFCHVWYIYIEKHSKWTEELPGSCHASSQASFQDLSGNFLVVLHEWMDREDAKTGPHLKKKKSWKTSEGYFLMFGEKYIFFFESEFWENEFRESELFSDVW